MQLAASLRHSWYRLLRRPLLLHTQHIVLPGTKSSSHLSLRLITQTHASFFPKPLPPLPPILDSEITETFLKGSGPGGQKINKTSSAVQLQHHPTGIVVKCQATRSRSQNRKLARRLLAERIEEVQLGDGARTIKKREEASRKKRSKEKKSRRKYRALGEKSEDDVASELEEGPGEVNDSEANSQSEFLARHDQSAIGEELDHGEGAETIISKTHKRHRKSDAELSSK